MTTVNDYQTIKANSIAISKSAKDLGKEIHNQCVVILDFIVNPANSKNVTLATHFYKLLSNDKSSVVRAENVKAWFSMFAPVKFGKQKDGTEGFKLDDKRYTALQNADDARVNRNDAKAMPFWKLSKEKEEKPWDFDKAIARILKTANDKATVLTDDGKPFNKIDLAKVAKMQELAKELGIEA